MVDCNSVLKQVMATAGQILFVPSSQQQGRKIHVQDTNKSNTLNPVTSLVFQQVMKPNMPTTSSMAQSTTVH